MKKQNTSPGKKKLMAYLQGQLKTPTGMIYFAVHDQGLTHLDWKPLPHLIDSKQVVLPEQMKIAKKILHQAETELQEYFKGQRRQFTIPLAAEGTAFQKSVWKALSQIPYGQVCSYKDIATKIKKPKATRAVGSANGKNPLPIIIPCHRVIRSEGRLGGFSAGLDLKTQLLKIEGYEKFK